MTDIKKLAKRWRDTHRAAETARLDLGIALAAALDGGRLQKDLVAETGINRETIRLLVHKAREHLARQAAGQ